MLARVRTPYAAGEYDARLQHALRMAKVGVWHMDLTGENRVWSREVATLIGLPADADIDRNVLERALHPDDRERVRSLALHALSIGSSFDTDCRVVWPDGSVHWLGLRAFVQMDRRGAPIAIEAAIADIEERKRLEIALAESQRSLRVLVNHVPGALYRYRKRARWMVDFISEGVQTLTGHTLDAFAEGAVAFSDLVHADDRKRVNDALQTAIAQRTGYTLTYKIVRADGQIRHVRDRARVYALESDGLQLEGLVTDITDQVRNEDERVRLEGRLLQAQKLQALGTLAGGIAHDFNNVLTAIKGNASLALADTPPESAAVVSISEIQRSAERAAELVRQILAFSRQDPSQRRSISMMQVTDEALRMLRATLPTLIEIRSELASDLPNVLADPTQLHQVVTNLGLNAAQAIGDNQGWIKVRVHLAELSAREATRALALRPGPYVCLTVTDSGCGMDAATLERIFDPFFTTKPAGQGTGLGLSVVHSIVAAHEGGMTVDSAPGMGTTFRLYFPLAPAGVEETAAPRAEAPQGRGQHILFVDDEEPLVFLAQRFFPRFGYEITGCETPERALELFRERPNDFDFVVTDLTMPTMSGHDLARELLRIRPDVPIVLASGYLRDQDAEIARAIGVREVVPKPSTIEDLVAKIHEVLSRHREQDPAGDASA